MALSRSTTAVVVGALLVGAALVGGIGATAGVGEASKTPAVQEERTVEGLGLPLPAEIRQQYLQLLRETAQESGRPVPEDVMLVTHSDSGVTWLVGTEGDVEPGRVTARGTAFTPEDLGTDNLGIMFASDTTVEQRGTRVSLDTFQEDPGAYAGELVRVSGTFAETSYLLEQQGTVSKQSVGFIGEQKAFPLLDTEPGRRARYSVFNISKSDSPEQAARVNVGLSAGLAVGGERNGTRAYGDERFWKAGQTTVDIMVISSAPGDSGSGPTLFPVQTQLQPDATVSPAELRENPAEYTGDVVAIEGSAVGASISAQETLVSVSKCAPDIIFIPGLPEPCIPAVGDIALHSGAIATADSPSAFVPYVGISNKHQNEAVQPERGRYRVVGRVVASSEIDPRLDAPVGVIVMERQRLGDLQLPASARADLEEQAGKLREQIRDQLTTTAEEFEQETGQNDPGQETDLGDGETEQPAGGQAGEINVSLAGDPADRRGVQGDSHTVVVVVNKSSVPAKYSKSGVRLRGNGEALVDIGAGYPEEGTMRTSWTISRELGREVRLTVEGQYIGKVTFAATPTPEPTATPQPADVSIVSVEQHGEAPEIGQTSAVSITLENTGGRTETANVDVSIGEYQVTKSVQVRPGQQETVTVSTEVEGPSRVVDVVVDGEKVGTVAIGDAGTATGAGPGFGIGAAMAAMLAGLVALRLRH